MFLETFHPCVRAWFEKTFESPTQAQIEAWPAIKSGQHTLIAAPTGSGKTLAAFLAAIDGLVWQAFSEALFAGRLEDRIQILYVSPLKALSNDIHKNLQLPLNGIRDQLSEQGFGALEIRAMVRTGDTPQGERERMRRHLPHILVTTPETLYLLLSSDSGRRVLGSVHTLIVDEIHALVGIPKGRLFPTSRGELVESVAVLDAVHRGELDRLHIPKGPFDVLAQQLVAEVSCGERHEHDLFD